MCFHLLGMSGRESNPTIATASLQVRPAKADLLTAGVKICRVDVAKASLAANKSAISTSRSAVCPSRLTHWRYGLSWQLYVHVDLDVQVKLPDSDI